MQRNKETILGCAYTVVHETYGTDTIKTLQRMRELVPTCDPDGVYSVKRTCAELGVSYKTLRKYKESGYIKPLNPDNASRPKYSGQSIIDCWKLLATL